jgi:serine/threonine-protein kinase
VVGLVGQTLGRYEIIAFVGRGGMGEVFRARDTELGRDVAVKVLSAETAQDASRLERFRREARAVAQLSHPNILAIHDFGTENGLSYSVTELLDGSDLCDRLAGHALPISKVLKVGRSVAEGLAAAHGKGIVHRDIKPANIFITKNGQVKILDFGIAGLKRGDGDDGADSGGPTKTLTRTGQMIGTTAYMSPEQVAGRPADSRSDIFSLGCVLYEMLTGQKAFDGATPNETLVAIVSKDPTPIAELRPDVPYALDLLVQRCLEKEPGERFESARDVAFAMEALSDDRVPSHPVHAFRAPRLGRNLRAALVGAAVVVVALVAWKIVAGWLPLTPDLPESIRLAVAPFVGVGGDPSIADFATGLGQSLAEDLEMVARQEGGIEWIVPYDEIANSGVSTVESLRRNYGVTLVITGEVYRSGDRAHLELEIVDPKTSKALRSAVIEDSLSNIDVFQFGPVRQVAELLDLAVSSESYDRIEATGTTMTHAFDDFTRGRGALIRAKGMEEVEAASALADTAVAEDPLFARGWVLRARSRLARFEQSGDASWLEHGLEDASRALEIGGRPEEAWRIKAELHRALGEIDETVNALEEGTRTAPDDADLRLQLAAVYDKAERVNDAEAQIRRAIYLRPDYWVGYDRLAKLQLAKGDMEAAAVEFRHLIDCVPEFALGYVKLAGVYMYLERYEPARILLERSLEIERTPWALTNLGTFHYDGSRFARAAEYFSAALELQDDNSILWGNLAYAYRFGAEPEKAEDAFRRAVELAEKEHAREPDDLELAVSIAGYHAMLGQHDQGMGVLDEVVAAGPSSPILMSLIAETYEDLGDRERAIEWVERSFNAGVQPSRFEGRPTLGKLVADERYVALAKKHTVAS